MPVKLKKSKNTIVSTEMVPLSKLKSFPKNPRKGNIDKIAESMAEFGQYRSIVVNKRTNEILAGNHTFYAAKKLRWPEISVTYVDVDDVTAKKIVLADNRLSDEGTYDETLLAELIGSLPDIVGVGYSQTEADDIVSVLTESYKDLDDAFAEFSGNDDSENAPRPSVSEVDFGDENEADFDRTDEDDDKPTSPDAFKVASSTMQGAFELKEDMVFEGTGYWNIPKLRSDMLAHVDDIPENLIAWAGSATKDWEDEDQWWLYNYGVDSTSGMKDPSKMILSFFCWDEYFEKFWDKPKEMVTKTINTGIKVSVAPNFSTWTDWPNTMKLYSVYKKAWVARYMQEAGLKIIPNVEWPDDETQEFLKKYAMLGIPKNIPVLAIQGQTSDGTDDPKYMKRLKNDYQVIYDTLEPTMLLYYGTAKGHEFVVKQGLPWDIFFVEDRKKKLGEQASKRKKKTTL